MPDNRTIISDERKEGLVYEFVAELDSDTVERRVLEKLRRMQRKVQVKGFRRGRAPVRVLRDHYGDAITQQVAESMATELATHIIRNRQLEPASRPTLRLVEHSVESSRQPGIKLVLSVEVFPTIELQALDFRVIRYVVTDDDVVPAAAEPSFQGFAGGRKTGSDLEKLAEQELRRQVFDELLRRHAFEVPDSMVGREHAYILDAYEKELGEAADEDLGRQFRAIAERRVRLAMLLVEIAQRHDIGVTREEVQRLIERQIERDPERAEEVLSYYIEHPTALAELQSPLLEEQVLQFILQRIPIDEHHLTRNELLARVERDSH